MKCEIRQHCLLLVVLQMAVLQQITQAFIIVVDAQSEECFTENLELDSKLGVTFEILEAGNKLDINVRITGAQGVTLHETVGKHADKFTINAHAAGEYAVCFDNRHSAITPKELMFSIEVFDPTAMQQDPAVGDATVDHVKLKEMLHELAAKMGAVKQEQEYQHVRARVHHAISESTNARLILWISFEAALLIAMTISQIYYLKRFFEAKRIV